MNAHIAALKAKLIALKGADTPGTKLLEKGVSADDICIIGAAHEALHAKSAGSLIKCMKHLAEEHDILEAAKAYCAVTEFILAAGRHARAAALKYEFNTDVSQEDIDGYETIVAEAVSLLKTVQDKHDLLKSLS